MCKHQAGTRSTKKSQAAIDNGLTHDELVDSSTRHRRAFR